MAFPQVGQNDALIGRGEEQNTHFPPPYDFLPMSGWYTTLEVERSMRITTSSMNPNTMKILIGSEPLTRKNGKTKNILSPTPPPTTNRIIPTMINRIPIDRTFGNCFNMIPLYSDTISYHGFSSAQ